MRRVLLFSVAILFAGSIPSIAAPVWGDQMDLAQPDGSLVPVRIWGDEYYQKVQSLDGRALVRDSIGWIRYASLAEDSSAFLPTGAIYTGSSTSAGSVAARRSGATVDMDISEAARAAQAKAAWDALHQWAPAKETSISDIPESREAAAAGSVGVRSVTGLSILVDFADQPASISATEISQLLNGQGYSGFGNKGSVHDYYNDISNGKLQYSNLVAPYVRLSKPKTYYENPSIAFGTRASELIREALSTVAARGFDFSRLTTDAQNNVLALNILYAGVPTSGWARGIWPHMSWMQPVIYGGKRFGVYELSNIGTAPAIGVICHENGHMVMGWPDLYDYSGATQGTGGYDLMSSSIPNNPVPPNAWLRDQAGWDSTTRLEGVPMGTVFKLPSNSNRNLRMDNPANPKEHFYVESRIRKGRSQLLPDEGLMIWLVDENGSNSSRLSSSAKHYLVSLIQADGRQDLEKGRATGPNDLYHLGYAPAFGPTTSPNSNWWSSKASSFKLTDIGPVADTMSVTWNGGAILAQSPPAQLSNPVSGLSVRYAEGTWTAVPTFTANSFLKSGAASSLVATFPSGRTTNYALAYDGYFNAPQAGNFSFSITTEGPARIWLDTTLRADLPAGGTKTFVVGLAKGPHLFRTVYVHRTGAAKLALTASGAGLASGAVPASAWSHEANAVYAADAATPSVISRGLRAAYYQGTWTSLPNFAALKPLRRTLTGSVSATSAGTARSADWGMVLWGWLKVDKLGTYQFSLGSADGSRMLLDGKVLIDNGGSHAASTLTSSVALWPGYHPVQVDYYQHGWTAWLDLKMAVPGGSLQAIPLSAMANDSARGLLPDEIPSLPNGNETSTANAILSIHSDGRALEVMPPSGYMGPVLVDILDAMGHVQGTASAASLGEGQNVRLNVPSGASMVLVRVRMGAKVETKMVPIAR